MNRTTRRWVSSVLVASGALTGCVGYDGGSDSASAQAQSLGITEEEEKRIRDALSQEAVSGDELAAFGEEEARVASIDAIAGDPRVLAARRDGAARFTQGDGEPCLGDINCQSGHCDVSGVCAPLSEFLNGGSACESDWECQSNRCVNGRCSLAPNWRPPGSACSSNSECKYGCTVSVQPTTRVLAGACNRNNGFRAYSPPSSPCSSSLACEYGCYATSQGKRCADKTGRAFVRPGERCQGNADCEYRCVGYGPFAKCGAAPGTRPDGGTDAAVNADASVADASVNDSGVADASVADGGASTPVSLSIDTLDDGRNGLADRNESDVDCGGESYYACPLNAKCFDDDDCVAGTCDGVRGSSPGTCNLTSGAQTDVARFFESRPFSWSTFDESSKTALFSVVSSRDAGTADASSSTTEELSDGGTSPLASYVPLYQSVRLVPRDRSLQDQRAYVNGRPKSRGPKKNQRPAPELDATDTRVFQHNTCMAHLLANGCSPVSWQARNHKVSYDYVVCPRVERSSIGIVRNSEIGSSFLGTGIRFKPQKDRGRASTFDDPFLCNHSYTRGVRLLSLSSSSDDLGASDLGSTRRPRFASGYGLSTKGFAILQAASSKRFANLNEIDRMLLIGAACNRGRVVVGADDGTYGPQSSVPTYRGDPQLPTRLRDLCTRFTDAVDVPPPSEQAWAWLFFTRPDVRPDAMKELERDDVTTFIRENVPYWEDHDIYAIDPEGNPYRPVNMNMQFNWDVNYGAYNFGLYVQSWSAEGTLPLTKSSSGVWGTALSSGFAPFNYGL